MRRASWIRPTILGALGFVMLTCGSGVASGSRQPDVAQMRLLTPEGNPAADAAVYILELQPGATEIFKFIDGEPTGARLPVTTQTDAAGRLAFERTNGCALFLHEEGVLFAPLGAIARAGGEARLVAWGRVRGKYMSGDNPVAGRNIAVHQRFGAGKIVAEWTRNAETDKAGRYDIEGVLPDFTFFAGPSLIDSKGEEIPFAGGPNRAKGTVAAGGERRCDFIGDGGLLPGDTAPDFQIKGLHGESIRLSDFRGRYLLLDFWATWCGPCRELIPHLAKAHERYKDHSRFAMLSASVDKSRDNAEKFVEMYGLEWRQAWLGETTPGGVADQYHATSIPTVVLIGPDGIILATDGYLRGEYLAKTLERIVGHP